MLNDFIKDILRIPTESQSIEFKRLAEDKVVSKIIETVVAMTNTDGGVIIFGIDDPEKTRLKGLDRIYGIDENIEVFDAIGREIPKIVPPVSGLWPPNIMDVAGINKRVALVFIPKATDSFRSINNHVFVRQEKGNRQLTAHEVVKFAYAKVFEKADKGPVDVSFELLQTPYFEQWKEARRINGGAIEFVLEKTGLARRNKDGKLHPTLAAVLLFEERYNPRVNITKIKQLLSDSNVKFFENRIIRDMRGNLHNNDSYREDTRENVRILRSADYSHLRRLKELLMILYQVRCNLFHGDKMYNRESDKIIISSAARVLGRFLKEYLI